MNRTDVLISAAALYDSIQQGRDYLIADCRFSLGAADAGELAYQQGHIPGARYWHLDRDLSGPKGQGGGRHPLPTAMDFGVRMRGHGLNSATTVVVYDDDADGMFAARAWWLLRFFGHTRVRLLDGGLKAWVLAGYGLSREQPVSRTGDFEAVEQPDMVLDYAGVAALDTDRVALVDARSPSRFAGLEEPLDPVAGHIPGAINMPCGETTDSNGLWHDEPTHRQRWAALSERPVVAYCGSGVSACANLVSLALAGRDDAKLYPGSWSDWCTRPGAPVEIK